MNPESYPQQNTELEAQNILQIEANNKLDEISNLQEANILSNNEVKKSVDNLEPVLDVIALNTQPKEVQKVELLGAEIVTIKGQKGDKGDKGDRGEKGEKGDTGPKGADSTIPGPKGDKGDQGIPGKDGNDGKDGRDGRDGRDGEDGKDGKDGKDGSPDTPKQIVDKLNQLTKQLDFKVLKNVPDNLGGKNLGRGGYLREISDVAVENIIDGQAIRWNATRNVWEPYTPTDTTGVQSVVAGTNVTVDNTDPANPVVSATSGGGGVTVETPSGDVDGVNQTYNVTAEPKWIVVDGITYFDGAGYTYSDPDIIVDTPPSIYIRCII